MAQETLKSLLPKFTQYLEKAHKSPATVLAYKADLLQFIAFAETKGKALLEEITQDIIEGFRDTLLAQRFTPKTVSRKLNAIKTMFRFLIPENHLLFDPSSPVAHPKIEIGTPKFLSAMEYRALRDVAREDPKVSTMIELMLQTGVRISEVAGLKKANLGGGKFLVEAYATQPERVIPLGKKVSESLEAYLKTKDISDSPYLFTSKSGKPLAVRNIRSSIDKCMTKAGISGFSVNDLRTTFVVHNLQAGVDIVLLSQVVGHKRLSTTERYLEIAGVTEPGKKQALEEL
jgi:site-specific recombinase XerD